VYSETITEIRIVPITWKHLDIDFPEGDVESLQKWFVKLTDFDYKCNIIVQTDGDALLLFRINTNDGPIIFASAILADTNDSCNKDFPVSIVFKKNSVKIFEPISPKDYDFSAKFGIGQSVQRHHNIDNLAEKLFAVMKEK